MQFTAKLVSSVALAATLASAVVLPRQTIPGNYTLTFSNQTAAISAVNYITFQLVETTADCTAFCDSVPECNFANSYHDNDGKDGSPLLTCSLYAGCDPIEDLTNIGGQTQPDGTVNSISDSDGWCKVTAPTNSTSAPATSQAAPTSTAAPTSAPPTNPTTTPVTSHAATTSVATSHAATTSAATSAPASVSASEAQPTESHA